MYMSLHIPGSMCVGVTLWFGLGGVVSVCGLKHYWSEALLVCSCGIVYSNNSYFVY